MIEKVARAMADCDVGPRVHRDHWKLYESLSRAAIAAMREPTEEMISKGSSAIDWPDPETAKETWQAMIDEALK